MSDFIERHTALQERIAEETRRAEAIRKSAAVVTNKEKSRYEVTGMLGKEGMGSVYKTYDHLLKRTVAYTKYWLNRTPRTLTRASSCSMKREPPRL